MTTTLILAAALPSVCGLIALWLILRFFWRVYASGGVKDLLAASNAVRRVRPPLDASRLSRTGEPGGRLRRKSAGGER